MSTIATGAAIKPGGDLLSRERIIAGPGFNRWTIPPAALAIHLCIGMAYGLSVFWSPLTHALNGAKPVACPAGSGLWNELFTTSCDWSVFGVSLTFAIGIVFLGLAAMAFGGWLERVGPRKAGVVAALCWVGGFVVGAFAIHIHQLWLLWLGLGVLGGVGLGIGYISPVSTLIRWFPDRRGMATGMAIMGFGGGAMVGAPLANILMGHFKTTTDIGVVPTFLTLAAGYLVYMMIGAFSYRVPPAGWRPDGWTPPATRSALISTRSVALENAHRTPQFWLLWAALFLNVAAGIGVIGMAAPMLQEIFGGGLIGKVGTAFTALSGPEKAAVTAITAGFAGLLSLFNIFGRFFWASLSDKLGRKNTYMVFFVLGFALYALSPWAAHGNHLALFVLFICLILSMYGGGFATVPAYLADLFGTQYVGAIHGRLLTAWSAAGAIGVSLVGLIRQAEIKAGVPTAQLYDYTFYVLSAFLIVGFIANLLVRPVDDKWHMSDAELASAQHQNKAPPVAQSYGIGLGGYSPGALIGWTIVVVPLLFGLYETLSVAVKLF
ncbi:MAG: OFA family MFS transporter [Hyphomicrobiales bacterium]|nr:OFA family MFS transporter [Hyphomicrobiales bacterium]